VANLDFAQGDVDLKLADIQGRLIQEERLTDRAEINVQGVNTELYILQITQNRQTAFQRIEIR
jgi:hypothetical protein